MWKVNNKWWIGIDVTCKKIKVDNLPWYIPSSINTNSDGGRIHGVTDKKLHITNSFQVFQSNTIIRIFKSVLQDIVCMVTSQVLWILFFIDLLVVKMLYTS